MPAPFQRAQADDARVRREAEEKAREAERVEACTHFRLACVQRAQKERKHQLIAHSKARAKWEELQKEQAIAASREHETSLTVRKRAGELLEFAQHNHERDRKRRERSVLLNNVVSYAEEQKEIYMMKQAEMTREQMRKQNYDRKVQVRKNAAAKAAKEISKERAEQAAKLREQNAEALENERRAKVQQTQRDKWIRAEMAIQCQRQEQALLSREKARKLKADEKKEELIEYLQSDHRVPRWYALGWHVLSEGKEWRWPFTLDWSWIERGARVLLDERFVGLKLPPGFVRPSERIGAERHRQAAERNNYKRTIVKI